MLRCQFLRHVLKALFFIKIALKLSLFCKKMQNFRALEARPPHSRASGSWWLCPQIPSLRQLGALPQTLTGLRRLGASPQTPETAPPHCKFLATRLSLLNLCETYMQREQWQQTPAITRRKKEVIIIAGLAYNR